MKQKTVRRLLPLMLLAALLCALLCVTAGAADTERPFLYYAASDDSHLIGVPEKLYFDEGMTIREALQASRHEFTGIDQDMVTAIDGVDASFFRGDELGAFEFDAAARSGQFFCFSTSENFLTENRQALIRVMAEYLEKPDDVQKAARQAYDRACEKYTDSDQTVLTLRENLEEAIKSYEDAQTKDGFAVRFTDADGRAYSQSNYPGIAIMAMNEYGRTLTDDDADGSLQLVSGSYTFSVVQDSSRIDGRITVDGEKTVSASLPAGDWMPLLRVSLSSGEEDFAAAELTVTKEDHTMRVVVPDTYASGVVYVYTDYDRETFSAAPSLYAYYTQTDGGVVSPDVNVPVSRQSWRSYVASINRIISSGATGGTVVYRVGTSDENGYTLSQEYTLQISRALSLSKLRVLDEGGRVQSATEVFSPALRTYTYQIFKSTAAVQIVPAAFRSAYTICVNGEEMTGSLFRLETPGDTTQAVLTLTDPETGYTGEYTLQFVKSDSKYTIFDVQPASAELSVYNRSGELIAPVDAEDPTTYQLITGQTYRYVVCDQGHYFAESTFVKAAALNTITVRLDMSDWIGDIWIGDTVSTTTNNLTDVFGSQKFSPELHEYAAAYSDRTSTLYTAASLADDDTLKAAGVTASEITLKAVYKQIGLSKSYNGKELEVSLPKTARSADGAAPSRGTRLTRFWMSNALGNTLTIRASRTEGGVTYYQDYTITLSRVFSLGSLNVLYAGTSLNLEPGYSASVREYTVKVPMAARELTMIPGLRTGVPMPYGMGEDGYLITIPEDTVQKNTDGTYTAALSGMSDTQTVRIVIENAHCPDEATTILLTVVKVAPVHVTVSIAPDPALLVLTDHNTRTRIWPEDGVWSVSEGFTYDYLLTAGGYVGQRGTLIAEDGAVTLSDGTSAPITTGTDGIMRAEISMSLDPAEADSVDHTIVSEWADFRGTSYTYDESQKKLVAGGTNYTNNGVVSTPTPISAEKSVLYWASKLGEGYSEEALGCPIIVDGYLIVFSRQQIYRVDMISGEVLDAAEMAGGSSFAINSPTYYDGMIFVGLSNGRVQAFDAKTLRSLWLYTDELGGQPNCPLIVYDGYLYTGFWKSETGDANYVCLSVTDEDPANEMEAKVPTWTLTQPGGFYWAGSFVGDDYMLLGTDDGQSGYATAEGPFKTAQLLLLDPKTGEVFDRYTGIYADQRSSICYDKETNAYYFTTKGGYFYRARVSNESGSWKLSEVRGLKLNNYADSPANPAMSTCTPVVYNHRAYIGVSGVGQFVQYSGHNLTVIDLDNWKIAYQVRTQGYAQTSGLLTTAYKEKTGNVYVYFFDNFTPGKLRVLSDRTGQTEPLIKTVESYNDKGELNTYDTPYVLFTPDGDQAQYAICSPIADQYGIIYFKNDSAQLMALGPTVESLTVAQMPDQTTYKAGDTFDPTGMVVTVTYTNGQTRDITDYVTYPTEPLSKKDEEFTITFPYSMYHNVDQADGTSLPGQDVAPAKVNIALTITADAPSLELEHIEITTAPTKTAYVAGEDFDAAGMVVTAYYADKTTKVLTSTEYEIEGGTELKAGTTEITVKYGEKTAVQKITVREKPAGVLGDVNGDGEVDIIDAMLVYAHVNAKKLLADDARRLADVNGDGEVDIIDAMLVYAYVNGKRTSFPAEQ